MIRYQNPRWLGISEIVYVPSITVPAQMQALKGPARLECLQVQGGAVATHDYAQERPQSRRGSLQMHRMVLVILVLDLHGRTQLHHHGRVCDVRREGPVPSIQAASLHRTPRPSAFWILGFRVPDETLVICGWCGPNSAN